MGNSDPTFLAEVVDLARKNWKYVIPTWIFPFYFYSLLFIDEPEKAFWSVVAPVFFLTFFWSSIPWLMRRVKYWHWSFLTSIIPFFIWCILVFVGNGVFRLHELF